MNKGMVYIFSGEGKGKTSAALGVALRMLLNNRKVVWVSWFKNRDWAISEMGLEEVFPKNLRMYWMGGGFYIKNPDLIREGVKSAKVNKGRVIDNKTVEDHHKSAEQALLLVDQIMNEKEKPDLIVMDEAVQAIKEGILSEIMVIDLICKRGKVNFILTGRGVTKKLEKYSDLVTEMKKVKHPFDSGKLAVKGLDY